MILVTNASIPMNFSINSTSFNSVKGYLILSWIHLLSILHLSLGLEGEFPTVHQVVRLQSLNHLNTRKLDRGMAL